MCWKVASWSVLEYELRSPMISRCSSYSCSLVSIFSSSSFIILFSSLPHSLRLALFNSSILSFSRRLSIGVELSSSAALSPAMPFSISASTAFIFRSSFALLFSTLLRHTNRYLFDFDSIFVPSTYCSRRLTYPSSTSNTTTCEKSPSMVSFRCSDRKRLTVRKSGCWSPESHMYRTSHSIRASILRHEYMLFMYAKNSTFSSIRGE